MSREFAKRLNDACDRKGFSPYGRQSEVRRRLEKLKGRVITPQGVSNWFRGNTEPRAEALSDLAFVLDVHPAWLSHGVTPSKQAGDVEPETPRDTALIDRNIQLTQGLWAFVDQLITEGGFADESDVMRAALRDFQRSFA